MSDKNKGRTFGGGAAAAVVDKPETATPATTPATNYTLTYRREHPGNRCSYGIAGNAGIVVFDRGLFADPAFKGDIIVDCALVPVKVDNKQAKAEALAAKLVERAAKAQAKIEAAAAKAKERQEKADAALAAAQAKVAAATATAGAKA